MRVKKMDCGPNRGTPAWGMAPFQGWEVNPPLIKHV